MKKRIHILGASGSGTTSLSKKLCSILSYSYFDTDDYYCEPSDPPYTKIRPISERQRLLLNDITSSSNWIIGGSLYGWGDMFIPYFNLVIFIYLPKDIRIECIKKREFERFGNRINMGRDVYEKHQEFIDCASKYDASTESG